MARYNFQDKLYDAIENYYHYNPDTLMPLLMISLAAQGKLRSTTKNTDGAVVLYKVQLDKAAEYDWVRLNPTLKKRFNQIMVSGANTISIEGCIDESAMDIYNTFHHYDTFTVEEEYHHRIGVLYHHSRNRASENAHRQYAAICLAEELIAAPAEWLNSKFLNVANHMLVKSGLQPERPRLKVAYALKALLKYDGIGKVYNPFAGCAIAAATIPAGENMFADGNENDKLFAVARLLNYGMGGSNKHYKQRDSTQWTDGKFDYVLSTYRGYVNGKSAFDFCLSKCFDTLTEKGKFAGIVAPKDIFENQSAEMKEALKRDWVETIALLPFGEVAVLVNAKKERSMKSKVRFFDLTHPMLRRRPIGLLLNNDEYAHILRLADVKKKGYLRSLVVPEIGEREGYEIVKLGDFVKKARRRTYSLANVAEDNRVMASIDRKTTYDKFCRPWMNGIDKSRISSLFAPAYHLTGDSLITNDRGNLEPRLFDADLGTAYFQDGYAFELYSPVNFEWLIMQLNEPYVLRQLHPYGMDEMVPETITEEQILNLKLYREIEDDELSNLFEENDDSESNMLPGGYELTGNKHIYVIHKFLGHGSFGYAYSAMAKNLMTGEEREVVLKEFYPHEDYHREGNEFRAVANDIPNFDIEVEKEKFRKEAEIMRMLGNTNDSHIVPAEELFESEKTGTLYYVMPFYHSGSLEDLQNSGTIFTEEVLLHHVVTPLCKALHVAHKKNVLHLDIKPENILVDDNGDAVLTDFGVAKQYDEEGAIINRRGVHGTSSFAAPEMRSRSAMVKFGSEPDIFSLSATLYNLATQQCPHPIQYNSDEDRDLRENMEAENLSAGFINAIIAGLQAAAPARPSNAQAFLKMFPGCEDIEL